jgi:hypothetical protein
MAFRREIAKSRSAYLISAAKITGVKYDGEKDDIK